MKFGYTILYVDDVVNTVSFYEKAFGLKRLFVHESNTYAEMDTGITRLAFALKSLTKENAFAIALTAEDVEAAFKTAIFNGVPFMVVL